MNIRTTTVAAMTLAMALVANTSFADIPPPDASGCYGKKAGEACLTDAKKNGGCVDETCTKGSPDGGISAFSCMICRESAAPASAPDESSGCSIRSSRAPWGACALIVVGLGTAVWFTRRRDNDAG
jgi:hypothetical protein